MFPAVPSTILLILSVCASASRDLLHPLSDEFIENINSMQSTWTAGRNFPKKTSLKYIYRLMGTYHDDQLANLPQRGYTTSEVNFPGHFDARSKWSKCPTLNEIRDQGACGSCWAVAAVSAMTDRLCTILDEKRHFHFSAQDVLSCCDDCGSCEGGYLRKAWQFYECNGIVSGGSYNSSQGCKPYEIPPCKHNNTRGKVQKECYFTINPPVCLKKCNENYKVKYDEDKHRSSTVNTVKSTGIINEIFNYGPVTSYFDVYEDFINYKSGIYNHTTGALLGAHSVKLIGWGKEEGVKYWLAANSWGSDWGDNGFFKIIRNDTYGGGCGIEDHVVVSTPIKRFS